MMRYTTINHHPLSRLGNLFLIIENNCRHVSPTGHNRTQSQGCVDGTLLV